VDLRKSSASYSQCLEHLDLDTSSQICGSCPGSPLRVRMALFGECVDGSLGRGLFEVRYHNPVSFKEKLSADGGFLRM